LVTQTALRSAGFFSAPTTERRQAGVCAAATMLPSARNERTKVDFEKNILMVSVETSDKGINKYELLDQE
jgi:hypothetical protein